MFSNTVYVKVSANRFSLRHVESKTEASVVADIPFTTKRLLIGQFQTAEKTLKPAIKKILKGGIFAVAPKILMHPLEMTEGGLSEVEERIFVELARGAGALKAVVWIGHVLTDDQVLEKLRAG